MKLTLLGRLALFAVVPLASLLACASEPPPPGAAVPSAGPYRGPVTDTDPYLGDRLTAAMITERVSGQTLYGCYSNGAPWAERLMADGTFRDMAGDRQTLGRWYVTPLDELCYRYEAGPNAGQAPYCYVVSETRDGLHFYTAGTDDYAASTSCPMPPAR